MAIDVLARGMAASAGGGGGGVDVGIESGVGIEFTGTDPVTITNSGVVNVATPGNTGADASAENGTIKVVTAGSQGETKYVKPKGMNNAAYKDVDTVVDETTATSTKLPTTKAVYDAIADKIDEDEKGAASGVATLDSNGKLPTTQLPDHNHVGTEVTLTGYSKPGTTDDIDPTDNINQAIGKLEKALDGKLADNTNYAGSSTPGGTATKAAALDVQAAVGSVKKGVYINASGQPVEMTCTLESNVPQNAEFTDTTYSAGYGIDIDTSDNNKIINTGVRSISNSTGAEADGTFKVNENGTTKYIGIKGLNNAAYKDIDADTISDTTSTTKLPTDKAVAAYASANYIPLTQKGANSGVAELDASGKVLASQLPSFVDDVIDGFLYSDTFYTETPQQPINEVVPGYYYNDAFYEDSAHTELITGVEGKLYLDITTSTIAGYRYNETDTEYVSTTITAISTPETGKIYTDISTNKSYRWGGSAWSLVASDLALGETATTAYRGDRGKIAYDHSQSAHAPSNAEANVLEAVKINGVAQTISNKAIDITADTTPTDGSDNLITSDAVYDALTDKVDKEAGKGLSANDLTDNLKNSYDGAVTHAGTTSGNPHNVTASDVGLGNVTNNAQVKAVSSAVTSGGIVTFGADGATVADSGKTIETTLSSTSDAKIPTSKAVATHVTSAISGKQDTLTFDNSPTNGSDNPVKSGGIYTALGNKFDTSNIIQSSTGIPASPTDSTVMSAKNVAENYAPNSSLVDTINNGAKNLLHFDGLSSATSYGVSFTINGDYSVTATRVSSSTTTASVDLTLNGNKVYLDDWCDGEHYLSGCPANGSGTTYEIIAQTDGTTDYIKRDYGNGILLDAKAVSDTNIVFRLIVRAEFTGTITFKPMISTKSQFGISPAYEPYALGNQVLTPAMIEQVDSGAKNILDFANVVYANSNEANYSKTDTSITVTNRSTGGGWGYVSYSYHLDVGTYVMSCKITNATIASGTNGIFRISSGTSGSPSIGNSNITGNGTYHNTFTITTQGTYYLVFGAEWNGTTENSNTLTASDIMICTLADWNVSHKHVPYRPNWDLVAKYAYGGGFVSSGWRSAIENGDLNSIAESQNALYHSPSNMPSGTSGYCFVRTAYFDSNAVLQELVLLSTGVSYVRTKYGNVWNTWKQTSNA